MGKQFVSKERKDKTCSCIRCKSTYVFTVKEQEIFQEKGYKAPKRCKKCRAEHKKEMESLNLESRDMYYGLESMLPRLNPGHFRGGIDVRDISGFKFGSNAKDRSWFVLV